ncbi:MAG TPA: ABC transporter substrate-binding protein [Dehalococcoidia bacterium]|nr:ABC transporter substrate-binding protein [Dehalococcoidia bacterium]
MKALKPALAALALMVAAVAWACGNGEEAAPQPQTTPTATVAAEAAFPLTVTQSDGETLTIQAPPQRIVSLSAHATDILCAIGAGDQLVAVEQYANCPEGSDAKPALDAYQPSVEAIAGYDPDLVYIFSDINGVVGALRGLGVPVLYLELPESVEGVLEQISLFGRITGHTQEAEALVAEMRRRLDAIEEKLADVDQGPRIFHELDPTYFTAAPQSFIGDMYRILKAQNIAEGATESYPQLSAEVIVERDPEVIVLADEPAGVTAEAVKGRPGWSEISAVKNGRICVVDPSLVSQPGPDVVDAIETLATCLYPDRFP